MARLKPFERFRRDVKVGDLVRIVFNNGKETTGYLDNAQWEGNFPGERTTYISAHLCLSEIFPPNPKTSYDISYLDRTVKGYEVLRRARPRNPIYLQPSQTTQPLGFPSGCHDPYD